MVVRACRLLEQAAGPLFVLSYFISGTYEGGAEKM